MSNLIKKRVDIAAASQFAGTEFRVQAPNPDKQVLRLKQALLQMGTESKTWRFVVVDTDGAQIALIQQSTDAMGVPAANTDESVILKGEDVEVILDKGQQVQVITTGATAAMRATLYFEVVDL